MRIRGSNRSLMLSKCYDHKKSTTSSRGFFTIYRLKAFRGLGARRVKATAQCAVDSQSARETIFERSRSGLRWGPQRIGTFFGVWEPHLLLCAFLQKKSARKTLLYQALFKEKLRNLHRIRCRTLADIVRDHKEVASAKNPRRETVDC